MKKRCVQLIIMGRVQGVGYRFAAQQVAKQYQLQGWVKNQPNGDVEIIAEGEQQQIDQFTDWAKNGPKYADVHRVAIKHLTESGEFTQFNIR